MLRENCLSTIEEPSVGVIVVGRGSPSAARGSSSVCHDIRSDSSEPDTLFFSPFVMTLAKLSWGPMSAVFVTAQPISPGSCGAAPHPRRLAVSRVSTLFSRPCMICVRGLCASQASPTTADRKNERVDAPVRLSSCVCDNSDLRLRRSNKKPGEVRQKGIATFSTRRGAIARQRRCKCSQSKIIEAILKNAQTHARATTIHQEARSSKASAPAETRSHSAAESSLSSAP